MFKKRRKIEDENNWEDDISSDWDDYEDDLGLDLEGHRGRASLPQGFAVLLGVGAVTLVLLLGGGLAYQMWWWTTPAYAAEEWFEAMWGMDGEAVLDRTCDQERWLSDTINTGSIILGLLEYIDITKIPILEDYLIPGIDISAIRNSLNIDISEMKMNQLTGDENTAVVNANGQVRLRILSGSFAYRIDETWLMVWEDDQWKWCGIHQP